MNNIAIIQQGTGRYLFSVPENVTLREGDRVKCSTKRGITDGIAFADSAWVDENVSQLIGKLVGAKFPLKPVVGKLEYLPFEKPEDKPTANPANKYEGMSNTQLYREMCCRGLCHARDGWGRKHDCLFVGTSGCNVTDADRAEVIEYLLAEDAESTPKPEDKPTEDKRVMVTPSILDRLGACSDGKSVFNEYFPDGGEINEVIAKANDINRHDDAIWLNERRGQIETMQDKREPIKLYCVKSYIGELGYKELSCGDICTFDLFSGAVALPNGKLLGCSHSPRSYDEWKSDNHFRAACLVPLVKRPAKVGEWVYITHTDYAPEAGARLGVGDVCRVASVAPSGAKHLEVSPGYELSYFDREYLVLDGYHPEPEAEPEPEYYNGKVVCVSSGDECFTVGKMYEFVNGKIKDDDGDERPVCYDQQFKSVEEWNSEYGMPIARFIEFKGEAND